MKKITLLVIMIVTAFTLNAQSLVKYHGGNHSIFRLDTHVP